MCIIVDIPVVHKIFPIPTEEFRPVHSHITNGRAKIVYGGKIRREYLRIDWFRRLLLRLDQQGCAQKIPDELVDAATRRVHSKRLCTSNDQHIIGLALIANVRLLCTDDNKLMNDFKNKRLLDQPRGKVYRNVRHTYLLRQHCSP